MFIYNIYFETIFIMHLINRIYSFKFKFNIKYNILKIGVLKSF